MKKKMCVLVVDDEPIMCKLAEKAMNKIGFCVLVAEDGYRAIEIVKNNPNKIDIVLLDLLMPQINGIETYKHMKDIQPSIKALLITGTKKERIQEEIVQEGVLPYIEKPYKIDQLTDTILRILGEKS